MAQCFFLDTDGLLKQSTQSVEECTGYVLISPTEYVGFYDTVGLNPEDALIAFAWGAGSIVTAWALSIPIKYGLRLIKLT